jgi:hypothetical protein
MTVLPPAQALARSEVDGGELQEVEEYDEKISQ